MGLGVGLNIPADHALWAQSLFLGGTTTSGGSEVVLKPIIATMSLALRIPAAEGMVVTLRPGLTYGAVTGRVRFGSANYDVAGGDGLGFTAAGSLDLFLSESLGFSAEAGFRVLESRLVYKNGDSSTGYSQWTYSGEGVTVDLGGAFVMFGLILRL
jgi:hypothetical protein